MVFESLSVVRIVWFRYSCPDVGFAADRMFEAGGHRAIPDWFVVQEIFECKNHAVVDRFGQKCQKILAVVLFSDQRFYFVSKVPPDGMGVCEDLEDPWLLLIFVVQ